MKKILILVAVALVATGLILMGLALALGGGWQQVSPTYREVTHEVGEAYRNLVIEVGSAEVEFCLSPLADRTWAVCDESESITYEVTVEGETLVLRERDERAWYEHIGFSFAPRTCVLYLPAGAYGSLRADSTSGALVCETEAFTFSEGLLTTASGGISFAAEVTGALSVKSTSGRIELSHCAPRTLEASASSGAIRLSDVVVSESMTVETSSGRIELSRCTPRTLEASASSGAIRLSDVVVSESMTVETSSGNISLARCDAETIALHSGSGRIHGSLLTDKLFEADSGSGHIDCSPSVKGAGLCRVKTGSGNISLAIAE